MPAGLTIKLAVLAGVVLLLTGSWGYIAVLRAQASESAAKISLLQSAASANNRVTERLRAAHGACLEARKSDAERAEAAALKLAAKLRQLERERRKNLDATNKIFTSSEGCKKLSEINISNMCSGYVNGMLRQYAD